MDILKLEPTFYAENQHLVEVLDKVGREWASDKERGYGIALVKHENLRFGIPLRSHFSHSFGFKTKESGGLDYSKAVLLSKDSYISQNPFKIPDDEFRKIKERSHFIETQFNKYVERYIKACGVRDVNILRAYAYSTLQNYHSELGIVMLAR